MAEDDLEALRGLLAEAPPPGPREAAARSARLAALEAFDTAAQASEGRAASDLEAKSPVADQGSAAQHRRKGMFHRPPSGLIRRLAMTATMFSPRMLALGSVSVAALALVLLVPMGQPDPEPAGIIGTFSMQGSGGVGIDAASGDALGASDTESALALAPPPPAPAPAAPSAVARQERLSARRQEMPEAVGDRMTGTAAGQAKLYSGGNALLERGLASMPSPEPQPQPGWREEGRDRFEEIEANGVKVAAEAPVSTFSIDVDTASYAFVRRSLMQGVLPPKDAVRLEELINYFPYDYPVPDSRATPFSTDVEIIDSPWATGTALMRIGIRGYSLSAAERPRANIVMLIDTSGSMNAPDKLPLLRNAMRLMVGSLAPEDTVSIVAYAGSAGMVLEPTPVAESAAILNALDRLQAGGSTAGGEGIRLAYQLAEESFVDGGVNRVMLATDGDFNVGITDTAQLQDFVDRKRDSGVFLSVLGFGRGNLNDALMQRLAQNGNGQAAYIDTLAEARKALVEEATSTLFPIASDVKIQVEFNPAQVAEYRLIGYETRALAREDFDNDKVDAGEIGAGHRVTALYEITLASSAERRVEGLRYQQPAAEVATTDDAMASELAFLKIRYKQPGEAESSLITLSDQRHYSRRTTAPWRSPSRVGLSALSSLKTSSLLASSKILDR
ncbi:MAG: VWA domain-containing protein, partial [Pseudomonadota bacterium]